MVDLDPSRLGDPLQRKVLFWEDLNPRVSNQAAADAAASRLLAKAHDTQFMSRLACFESAAFDELEQWISDGVNQHLVDYCFAEIANEEWRVKAVESGDVCAAPITSPPPPPPPSHP